ncbi:MAG TPA: efflux RND transporter periplasmic adaptor subunit [Candidatus Eisenbacteria bacterium]
MTDSPVRAAAERRAAPRSRASARFALAAAFLAALAGASGCGDKRPSGQAPVPVLVGRAEIRAVPFEIAATGTVEPIQTVSVLPQVGGLLTRVSFREGAELKAGQVLFQIDPRPYRAALDQALATLSRDRAQAAAAVPDAERFQALAERDYATRDEYEQKRADAEGLLAAVRADSAAVENARLNLEYATIRAPISGRAGALLVHEGNVVKASATDPLVTINQIHPIRVRFAVPESFLDQIQAHRAPTPMVTVQSDAGDSSSATGRLTFVDNGVDPATGTILLKAEFPNEDRSLWPGEFVGVRLVLYVEPKALVVPATAVVQGQQGASVFVLKPGRTVAATPVAVARTAGDLAVIARGLAAGDSVIVDGQSRLADKSKVVVQKGNGTP